MNTKSRKPTSPKDPDRDSAATDQLQEQIDALVRGEVPTGSRSLRDLAKPTKLNKQKNPNDSNGRHDTMLGLARPTVN